MALGCYDADYLAGSFKGVPMEVMTAESDHGRRGATGEFPFGEDTAYADLGRRIRKYTLKVRFVENSHVADAEALINACESPGPGPLAHPTRGIVQAACVSLKVRDDIIEEQGVTYADLEMVEANDWPAGLVTGGSFIGLVIGTIIGIARDAFLSDYRPLAAPQHRRAAIHATASAQIGAITQEYKRATPSTPDTNILRAISDLEFIAGDPVSLDDPALVDKAIAMGISAVAKVLDGDDKFQAMRRIANSAARSSPLPSGSAEAENAVYALARIVSGAFLAQAGLETEYTTASKAFEYYDIATTVLEAEANNAYQTCSNVLFVELRRFITSFQTNVLDRAYNLPSLIEYNFHAAVHPLVAAYSIFGDAKRHREFELSNLLSQSGRIGPSIVGASA